MSRHAIRRYASIVALAFVSLLGLSLVLRLEFPTQTATQQLAHGYTSQVVMPWRFGEVSNGNRLSVHLTLHWFSPRRWNIIPDDRLTALSVNGEPVPLERVRPGGVSDWLRGFDIDLSPWMHNGDNQLDFTVDNYLGPGGILLRPLPGWRMPLLAACLLPWLLALARLFRLRPLQTAALAGGLLVLCLYWAATPWTDRNYDVLRYDDSGHLGYVGYVAHHLALPRPNEGWEYFQPPLYYVVGAGLWRWAEWLGLPPAEMLQGLALGFWLIFLAASAAALRIGLRRSPAALVLATVALALWPSGIIHGLRIGNDPPFYAAAAVATWFMLRWWRGGHPRHLYGMALAIAAALLCKTSAAALLGAAALLLAARLLRRGGWKQPWAWAQALAAASVMAAGALLAVARNLWYWQHGLISNWLNPSMGALDAGLRVPKLLRGYIPLDIPVFLTSPWVDSRDDATGRTNFWNFLLRSSFSGEFAFDGHVQRLIAWAWGLLLLGLLALLLHRLGRRWPAALAWRDAPWIVLGLTWLASLLSLHIKYPYSCHSDFRLILPILVPFLVACVRAGTAARVLLALLAGSSVVFFAALQ